MDRKELQAGKEKITCGGEGNCYQLRVEGLKVEWVELLNGGMGETLIVIRVSVNHK